MSQNLWVIRFLGKRRLTRSKHQRPEVTAMIIPFSTIAFFRIEIDLGSRRFVYRRFFDRNPSDQSQFRDKNYCYANLKDYKINENNGSMIYKDGTYEDYKNPKGTEFSFWNTSEKFDMILNDTSFLRCHIFSPWTCLKWSRSGTILYATRFSIRMQTDRWTRVIPLPTNTVAI